MRIWNEIDPHRLCKKHLLAEHREALCIWSVITQNKKGYSKHPETVRYRHHLGALWLRHRKLMHEATRRGYNFKDLPDWPVHLDGLTEIAFVDPEPWDKQEFALLSKDCNCIKVISIGLNGLGA